MTPEIQQLLAILDQAYDRQSWHGTNLRGSIRRVNATQAAWRPAPNRHNIWETVVHAAYWKYAAARRFTGGSRGLGREMALAIADAGADVVLTGRDKDSLLKTAAEIEAQVSSFRNDA